jgi:glutathione S-transferase
MTQLRLISIGASHYCEKARWALDRAGLAYVEEPHPPVFAMLHARWAGGRITVPVLVTPQGAFNDSTGIVRWVDGQVSPERRLFPDDPPALRQEVDELEELFDEVLGPHSRRWGYSHLLPDPRLIPLAGQGAPCLERFGLRLSAPLARTLMRRKLRITPASVQRSRERIDEVLTRVEGLLADGRPHLAGERFTAADLTLAALAAPLLFPVEYGGPLPPADELPAPMRGEVEAYRARPAGEFVMRLYREERSAAPVPA